MFQVLHGEGVDRSIKNASIIDIYIESSGLQYVRSCFPSFKLYNNTGRFITSNLKIEGVSKFPDFRI